MKQRHLAHASKYAKWLNGLDQNERKAVRILNQAYRVHQPSKVVCTFSGGHDSMISTYLTIVWAAQNRLKVAVIAAHTLIAANGWCEFVTDAAKAISATDFKIWDNPDLDLWTNDVRAKGFVYRRKQHPYYFYFLKQRVFRMVQAHYKQHKHDRIMFVQGIRRDESHERRNAPAIEVIGSGVWVSPLVEWSNYDTAQYHAERELPHNPFYAIYGNSGDCLCNWHNNIALETVQRHSPNAYAVIAPLDAECRAERGYGYDDEPSRYGMQEAAGQLRLIEWDTSETPNLCAGCQKPQADSDAQEYVLLQRMAW